VASLQALTFVPDEPHALALLAEEMRQGHHSNALKYLQAGVAKNPKSAVAEEAMGRYLDANKEYVGAESAFKKAIALDPSGRRRKYRWEIFIWSKGSLGRH
jgi:tetratricopeptide (TPR) repeat protein